MPSTRNLMVASIVFIHPIVHAVTLSANLEANEQNAQMHALTMFTPEYSKDSSKIVEYAALAWQINPKFSVESVSASVQGSYAYSEILGFFGTIGATSYLEDSYLFAQGSLLIEPHISPFISAGGYYLAQNGAKVELGAMYTRFTTDITTKSNGALFNNFPEIKHNDMGFNSVNLGVNISIPVFSKFHVYAGMHFGPDMLLSEAPILANVKHVDRSVLTKRPDNPQNVELGNLYGRNIGFSFNRLTLGTRFDITDIYE
ncbi:MAG: hypothetical protein VXW87_03965 [Pseudomonadota bacterium]|nr:hypothetical protein [Pseudomonadota bacterium]